MGEILAVALQSMHADMARVEQAGMNLANAATPGYKRGVVVQSTTGSGFAAYLSGAASATAAADSAATVVRADSRAGTLRATGQPMDLAIAGRGYFEVATDKGPAYTRLGSFRLDTGGRLVTAQGYPVMGLGGDIVLPSGRAVISPTGAILAPGGADETPLAQLRIVDFDSAHPMQRLGEGLLEAGEGLNLVPPEELQVRQGYLENANVASVQEMASLMQAMRHFETMRMVVQGYDEMMGTAVRKLGETS